MEEAVRQFGIPLLISVCCWAAGMVIGYAMGKETAGQLHEIELRHQRQTECRRINTHAWITLNLLSSEQRGVDWDRRVLQELLRLLRGSPYGELQEVQAHVACQLGEYSVAEADTDDDEAP